MGKSTSAPAPPDYASLIPLQEAAYNRSFNRMLGSSRVNSQTPFGSQYWIRPGAGGQVQTLPNVSAQPGTKTAQGVPPPQYIDIWGGGDGSSVQMPNPEYAAWQQSQTQGGGPPPANPTGLDIGDFGDPWTLVQQLSPEQQALYDQDLRLRMGQGNIAEGMMGNVADIYGTPQDFAGMLPGFNRQDPAEYTQGQWGGPDYRTDMGSREDAERAIYNRQMRYAEPMLQRRRQAENDRLTALGANTLTDDRYRRRMDDITSEEDRFYADAADRAILGGGQEATAELARGLSAAQARFGAEQGERQFGYNAAQQGQGFRSAEDMRALQYALQNISVSQQDRARALNELNAFRTGQQVQLPGTPAQFNTPNLQSVDPMAAAGQTYAGQLGQWNANQAASNNFMNGLFGLGGAAVGSAGFFPWMKGLGIG